jgi:ribosomal protein S18 acetylase RimI-like enzyme
MNDEICLSVYPSLQSSLIEIAQLFVDVDAAYGEQYWWHEVRTQGMDGAIALLHKDWHAVVVATDNNKIVGFAGLDEPVGHDVEIIRIMTHPDHTGKGVASRCIEALLTVADNDGLTVWLDVLTDATGAIGLYEKFGFVEFDNKPGEHSKRPAIQMRRLHPNDK